MKKIISLLLVAVMLLTLPWLASCAQLISPSESSPEGSGGPSNPGDMPEVASKTWHYLGNGFPGLAEFSFDKDGKLVLIENLYFRAGYEFIDGVDFLYRTFNYEDGKLVDSVAYQFADNAGKTEGTEPVEKYRVKYVYGEDGKIIRGDFLDGGLKTNTYDLYTYEGSVCTVKCFDKGVCEEIYKYDTATNRFVDYDNKHLGDITLVYGEDGNIAEVKNVDESDVESLKVEYKDNKVIGFSSTEDEDLDKYSITYLDNGAVSKIRYNDEDGNVQEYTFLYDEKGRNTSAMINATIGEQSRNMGIEYVYDENGMYAEAAQIEANQKVVRKLTRDENGRLVKEESLYYTDGKLQKTELDYTYTYNEKGQLIEKGMGQYDTNTDADLSKTVYEYYESGALKKTTYGNKVNEYYENGLKKSSVGSSFRSDKVLDEYLDYGINFNFDRHYSYDYASSSSEGDRNADKTTVNFENNQPKVIERTFDDMHRVLSVKTTYPRERGDEGRYIQCNTLYSYTYDENGNEAICDIVEDNYAYATLDSVDPVSHDHIHYTEYYENDRTVRENRYDAADKLWAEIYYSYDGGDRYISKIVTYNGDGSQTVKEYDKGDNVKFPG